MLNFACLDILSSSATHGDHVGANEYIAKTENMYAKVVPSYNGTHWLSAGNINGLMVLTSR